MRFGNSADYQVYEDRDWISESKQAHAKKLRERRYNIEDRRIELQDYIAEDEEYVYRQQKSCSYTEVEGERHCDKRPVRCKKI